MRREVHPALAIGALALAALAALWFFLRVLAPHERILRSPNARFGPTAKRENLRAIRERARTRVAGPAPGLTGQ